MHLTANKILFEAGGQSISEVNDQFVVFLALLTDIANSYDYSVSGLQTLIDDNIAAINALGLELYLMRKP